MGHKGEISKVAFNPSGNKIITASADNTARILYFYIKLQYYSSETGECL